MLFARFWGAGIVRIRISTVILILLMRTRGPVGADLGAEVSAVRGVTARVVDVGCGKVYLPNRLRSANGFKRRPTGSGDHATSVRFD